MGEPILQPGVCTTDTNAITRAGRENYTAQPTDDVWSWDAISSHVRQFVANTLGGIEGRVDRTDMVYVSPDATNAVSMTTLRPQAGESIRVYCGLEPAPPTTRETITVVGERRTNTDDAQLRTQQRVDNFVNPDRGNNPNRSMDFRLPGFGQCAGGSLEDNGITLRFPTGDGSGQAQNCPSSPDGGFTLSPTRIIAREREEREEQIRRRSGGSPD